MYVTVATAALIVIAWTCRAALADLGLRRVDLPSGLLYGGTALGLVLVVLILAAAVPLTNGFLHDARAQIGGARLAYELGVTIVLLTAVPEEFAFRGYLVRRLIGR